MRPRGNGAIPIVEPPKAFKVHRLRKRQGMTNADQDLAFPEQLLNMRACWCFRFQLPELISSV
jgi:hypothetical protein